MIVSKTTAVFELGEQPSPYGMAVFTHPICDGDKQTPTRTISMQEAIYRDMGSPERITVTIEPGDQLNEGNQ